MIKSILNKMLLLIYFVVGALIIETITFIILNLGFFPEYYFYNFSVLFFIAVLVFAIPNYTVQYIIYSALLVVQGVFSYINYSLQTIYRDILSIDLIGLAGEAGAAMTANFFYFTTIFQLVAVCLGVIISGFYILKYCRKEKIEIKKHFSIFNVIILIVCQCVSLGYFVDTRNKINTSVINFDETYVESDSFLLNTSILKTSSYKKFGSYGYFLNLLINRFGNYDQNQIDSAIKFFNNGEIYNGTYQIEINGQTQTKDCDMFGKANADRTLQNVVDGTQKENVIVIMMESLEWFAFCDGNYDKDIQNLSNELTPNIYELINSDRSMIAKNFFAKSKTNYSEAIGIMGSYPTGWALTDLAGEKFDSSSNAFGYTLPNMLKTDGYKTSYVHSNTTTFYKRDKTHKNLGFDVVLGKENITNQSGENIYSGDDLLWGNWDAEADFVRNAINTIVPYSQQSTNNQPFYTYYLSVSTHGGYMYSALKGDVLRYNDYISFGKDFCVWDSDNKVWKLKDEYKPYCSWNSERNRWQIKNGDEDKIHYTLWYQNVLNNYDDEDLIDYLYYYECAVCGLDEAVEVIIDRLKECDIYDNTTLLLYSDHYAYYDNMSNRIKGIALEERSSVELNTIPMIISSDCLKNYHPEGYERENSYLEYERFCSAYDIVPTILDMLGIKFNKNFYLGQSLFYSVDYVYSYNGEIRDMVIYYSNTGGLFGRDIYTMDFAEFKKYDGVDEITEQLFKSACMHVLSKINYMQVLNTYKLYDKLNI